MGFRLALLILTLITLALFGFAVYLKLRRRFTRERYAFAALGATVSIAFLAISSIGSAPPWTVLAALVAHFLNDSSLAFPQPTWSERLLVLLFAAFAVWMLHRNFAVWNGPISVRQSKMERLHDSTSYVIEGMAEVLRILRNHAPSPVYSPEQREAVSTALEPPSETRAWRDDARELVELKWQQYAFDPVEDWHERANCWVGRDVKTGAVVALNCCQDKPAEDKIYEFVGYVVDLPGHATEKLEFLIVVRSGSAETQVVDGHTVRIESEDTLLDDLVDFTDYVVDIRRRVERDHLPDSDLTLPDIYSPSLLFDANGEDLGVTLEDYLLSWLQEAGQRQLTVLGEYGQGKSTGMLMFTHRLLTTLNAATERIPLFIELRGKSPATLQPIELLGAWASRYRIDPRALLRLLVKGRLAVIFEGFDEMAGVADADARLNHFRALWKFCFPAAKLVFTGRPNFFLDDTELRAALGIGSALGTGPYCEHVHLKPFGLDQIRHSLRWVEGPAREDIVALAQRDEKFCDIVARPSLLYIVGRLWGLSGFSDVTEGVDAAKVMGAFIRHCYRRQTEKHRGAPHFMVLTEDERKYFMDGVAAYMAAHNMPNQVTSVDFDGAISGLYDNIPDGLHRGASLPEPLDEPLKVRLEDRNDALIAIQTDVRTYGLLVRDYSRPNALKFPHKSFFEYLLGDLVANTILEKSPEYYAAIRAATDLQLVRVMDVPESISFLGEIVSRTLGTELRDEAAADRLFDAVVLTPQLRFLSITRRFYLRWVMWERRRRGLVAMLVSSAGGMFAGLGVMAMDRGSEMVMVVFVSIVMSGSAFMVLIARPLVLQRGRNGAVLWYIVAKAMGIADEFLEQRFGRRGVSAARHLAEELFGKRGSDRRVGVRGHRGRDEDSNKERADTVSAASGDNGAS